MSIWFLTVLLGAGAAAAPEVLPAGSSVEGKLLPQGRVLRAETAAKVTIPFPAQADVCIFRLKAGKAPDGVSVSLKGAGAPAVDAAFRARDQKLNNGQTFGDSYLELAARGRLFVRPNVEFYKPDRIAQLRKEWDALPPASEHAATLELRRSPGGVQVWVDGRFLHEAAKAPFTSCEVRLAAGAELHGVEFAKRPEADVLPLPLEHFARPGAMAGADVKLSVGSAALGGCPAPTGPAIDVGGLGRLAAPVDDLVSFAWRRSSLDALGEFRIFSVPLATYSHAEILCAGEDDPAKIAACTIRVTRNADGRGDALADSMVRVPAAGAADSPGARRVGTVTYGLPGGRKTVPLWLLRIPLKNGLIQDLLRDDQRKNNAFPSHRYLDVELLDPLDGVDECDAFPPTMAVTGRAFAPRGKRSGVHVFGLALDVGPAELTVRSNPPMHMFYSAESPAWNAVVEARRAGSYAVSWEFADIDGKIAASGRRELTLAAGAAETVSAPVSVSPGWYATRFRLSAADGRDLVDHRASFVMLPPDTRKAGFESPHGAWWFHYAHGGKPDLERVGPVLQRAGLRHTTLPKTLPESVTSAYGVTEWNVHWFHSAKKPTIAERIAEHEQHIRETLKLWPSLDKILVWHESGTNGAAFPSELWGQTPPPPDDKVETAWRYRMEYVTALARMVREKFPKLKLQFGNDGSSLGIIAELLRRKFPRELIDTIAVEDLGQTIITEKPIINGLQSAWYLGQTARKLGYDIPVTACYEWMGRRDGALGLAGQAEWYVRDALHARAYGFTTIAVGTIHDAGAGYFHTLWGAGGLCRRYPTMDPKPSYAAMATLTRVLDSARFERAVPTGSLSLYALEFRRGDEWIYAAWVPRGRREAKFRFPSGAEVRLIDLCGREKVVPSGELPLTVSTAAQYLVTKTRLEGVAPGRSWFLEDAPPANPIAACALEKASEVALQDEKDKRLERTAGEHMPHRTQGRFELREVTDPEKGPCLELELKPHGEVWDATAEYAVLKLKNPVAAAGPVTHAGVWVKGNSGWGDVMWEVRNAKGGTYFSQGVYMDWPGQVAINFDGWNFLRLQLPVDPVWRSNVQITGLAVTVPRKMIYVSEMVPVPELKVRLKGLCLFNCGAAAAP